MPPYCSKAPVSTKRITAAIHIKATQKKRVPRKKNRNRTRARVKVLIKNRIVNRAHQGTPLTIKVTGNRNEDLLKSTGVEFRRLTWTFVAKKQ